MCGYNSNILHMPRLSRFNEPLTRRAPCKACMESRGKCNYNTYAHYLRTICTDVHVHVSLFIKNNLTVKCMEYKIELYRDRSPSPYPCCVFLSSPGELGCDRDDAASTRWRSLYWWQHILLSHHLLIHTNEYGLFANECMY